MKKIILFFLSFIAGNCTGIYFTSNYYAKRETAAQNLIHAGWAFQFEQGLDPATIDSLNTPESIKYKEAEYNYRKVLHLFEDCADDGSDFTWSDFFRQFI